MADGLIGEIRAFGFNFTPRGWLPCNGSTYNISSFAALFSIIGIEFGGNGTTNFNVPNLNGKSIVGVQPNSGGFNVPGATGGTEAVTLTSSTMPAHNHLMQAVTRSSLAQTSVATAQPAANVYLTNAFCTGLSQGIIAYSNTAGSNTQLNPQTISLGGGSMPHYNMSPYLAMTYCICAEGIFPARP
jgi:microcystin-dependent protein